MPRKTRGIFVKSNVTTKKTEIATALLSFRPSGARGEICLTDISTSLDMTIEYDNKAGITTVKGLAMTKGDSESSSE